MQVTDTYIGDKLLRFHWVIPRNSSRELTWEDNGSHQSHMHSSSLSRLKYLVSLVESKLPIFQTTNRDHLHFCLNPTGLLGLVISGMMGMYFKTFMQGASSTGEGSTVGVGKGTANLKFNCLF